MTCLRTGLKVGEMSIRLVEQANDESGPVKALDLSRGKRPLSEGRGLVLRNLGQVHASIGISKSRTEEKSLTHHVASISEELKF